MIVIKNIFIDGREGTTGLEIFDRLKNRDDVNIILLPDELRKDEGARKEALNSCDIAILCLPDDASRQAVEFTTNPDTVIIDASTAHRTCDGWVYGLPELSKEKAEEIAKAKRIAVPGCHASGFITLVKPLIHNQIISDETLLTCFSLTGYSGGGKKMIAQYEDPHRDNLFGAPRMYGLTQQHKHLKEMVHVTGLKHSPVFCPVVGDFYSGMLVSVPLFKENIINGYTLKDIVSMYKDTYNFGNVHYNEDMPKDGFLNSNQLSVSDKMEITVTGNDDKMVLSALYNNLGKGASGAAVQCLDLVLKG